MHRCMKLGKYNCPTSNFITINAVEFQHFVVQKHVFIFERCYICIISGTSMSKTFYSTIVYMYARVHTCMYICNFRGGVGGGRGSCLGGGGDLGGGNCPGNGKGNCGGGKCPCPRDTVGY